MVGALLNDPATLASLGGAVNEAPYKAPPSAPVLYIKPRNTFAAADAAVQIPAGVPSLELGACLGLVIGRMACRVTRSEALRCVAGLVAVADLSVPHASFYRPAVRLKAIDGSCRISAPVPLGGFDPDAAAIRVLVDHALAQEAETRHFVRQAAHLLADVSDFMTLRPGDVLLTGVPYGAPQVRAGQRARIEIAGVGALELRFEAAR